MEKGEDSQRWVQNTKSKSIVQAGHRNDFWPDWGASRRVGKAEHQIRKTTTPSVPSQGRAGQVEREAQLQTLERNLASLAPMVEENSV